VPKTNVTLWREKITMNKQRDRRTTRELGLIGWKVIRIWECSLNKNPAHCLKRIAASLVLQ
jgi:DNA mismatch endonuclease (patch repair protein)